MSAGAVSEPAALDFEDPAAAQADLSVPSTQSTPAEQGMHRRVLPLPGLAAADSPAREDAEASFAIRHSPASLNSPAASHAAELQAAPIHPEAAEVPLTRIRALPIPNAQVTASEPAVVMPELQFEPAFDLDSEIQHAQAALSMLLAEADLAPQPSSAALSASHSPVQARTEEREDEIALAVAAAAVEAKQALSKRQASKRAARPSSATRAELRLLSGLLQRQGSADLGAAMPAAA